MKASIQQRFKAACSLSGVASFAAVAGLMASFAQPASAANVSCQAINATGVIAGAPPTSNCSGLTAGDSFEIDLSEVFAANSGSLPLDKFYSLQIANLNTGPSNTLTFSNVEFLITGTTGNGPIVVFNDQPITIWSTTAPTSPGPLAQGLGSYTTSGTSSTFPVIGAVQSQASFTLTGPVTPQVPNIGTAALISTFPIDLQRAGVSSFTGAKIRGTFGGSSNSVTAFSAGLAQFASSPFITPQAPSAIYGNAFNVPTPGPLPVLGAGAAFGMSRRLRRRIGASKVAA
jgi:hypothetical protein